MIISNPPYYENSTLGNNESKNTARHTLNLSIEDFYRYSSNFLMSNGEVILIFPSDLAKIHIKTAKQFGLFPKKIITVIKDNQKPIRNIICYSFNELENIDKESIIMSFVHPTSLFNDL